MRAALAFNGLIRSDKCASDKESTMMPLKEFGYMYF